MLQKNENQEEKSNTPLSNVVNSNKIIDLDNEIIDLDDEIECAIEGEMDTVDKVLATTKTKPKMVRKNIEHYLEERALKRRVRDVFEDELLLLD